MFYSRRAHDSFLEKSIANPRLYIINRLAHVKPLLVDAKFDFITFQKD